MARGINVDTYGLIQQEVAYLALTSIIAGLIIGLLLWYAVIVDRPGYESHEKAILSLAAILVGIFLPLSLLNPSLLSDYPDLEESSSIRSDTTYGRVTALRSLDVYMTDEELLELCLSSRPTHPPQVVDPYDWYLLCLDAYAPPMED